MLIRIDLKDLVALTEALGKRVIHCYRRLYRGTRVLSSLHPVKNSKLLWKHEKGEVFLIDPESGNFYNLNPIASCIWHLSEGAHSVSEISGKIVKKWCVNYNTAENDTKELLEELSKHGLINFLKSTPKK